MWIFSRYHFLSSLVKVYMKLADRRNNKIFASNILNDLY